MSRTERGLGLAAEDEFDKAVENEADPGVDKQAPIETVRLMTCGGRKVWHEDEEVEQAAEDDGSGLLEKAGAHGRTSLDSGKGKSNHGFTRMTRIVPKTTRKAIFDLAGLSRFALLRQEQKN